MQTARAGGPAGQQDDQQDSAAEQAVSVPAAQSAITASQLEYLSVAALRRQIRDPDKHAASRPDERSNMETEQLQLRREMLARNLAEKGRNAERIVRLQEAVQPTATGDNRAKLNNRAEGERGTQIPSPASAMPTAAEGNRAAESDVESKRREPIFSPASAMQTAAKLNSRAEGNRGTLIPSPASAMQTARQEDTRQLKSTDSKRRAEILSPASITSAATVGFKTTALATTTLPELKQMGLSIAVKASVGSEQNCLDTAATSIAATAERRQVGLATAADAADKAGKGVGGDTVARSFAADETYTPVCSETAEISVDNAGCKRETQKLSSASVTSAEKAHAGQRRARTRERRRTRTRER